MTITRIAKFPTPDVREWNRVLLNAAGVERIRPPRDKILRLAALLTITGTTASPEAQRLFWAIRALFLNPARIARWEAALHAIPADRVVLLRIADCCFHFAAAAGDKALPKGQFQLDQVVTVMRDISDPEAYVENGARSNFLAPGALFHPNTLEAARRRLRGAMGEQAHDRPDYDHALETRLRRVRA